MSENKFATYTPGQLADELGAIKACIAPLAEREEAIKDELKRREIAEAEGLLFRVTVAPSPRTIVDSKRLKAERPDIYRQYSYTSSALQVTCGARKGVKVPTVPTLPELPTAPALPSPEEQVAA